MRAACLAGLLLMVAMTAGASGSPRSDCTAREVRAAVGSFVTAFNRGDYERLDSLFAAAPQFEWYSSERPGRRLGRKAKRRHTLIGYFQARHAAGDRFDLVSFGFNGNSPGYGNFELIVRRSSPGFRGGGWVRVLGKGAAVCDGDSVEFIVMTYGRPLPAGSPALS